MMGGVQVAQAVPGDVRIDLCRRQVAVSEEHLYHAQIGAMIEQMRGERMTHGVRREGAADTGLLRVQLDAMPKCCLLYTSPSPRDRQKSRMPSSA